MKNNWRSDLNTLALDQFLLSFVLNFLEFLFPFEFHSSQTSVASKCDCRTEHPSKGDAGEYKCSVKNKWGTDYTTFQLG